MARCCISSRRPAKWWNDSNTRSGLRLAAMSRPIALSSASVRQISSCGVDNTLEALLECRESWPPTKLSQAPRCALLLRSMAEHPEDLLTVERTHCVTWRKNWFHGALGLVRATIRI